MLYITAHTRGTWLTSWWHRHPRSSSFGRRWRWGTPEGLADTCRSWSYGRPGICRRVEKKRRDRHHGKSLQRHFVWWFNVICNCVWMMGVTSSHLWSFGLVLPIEELGQGSPLNLMDANRKGRKMQKEIKVSVSQSTILNDEKLTYYLLYYNPFNCCSKGGRPACFCFWKILEIVS